VTSCDLISDVKRRSRHAFHNGGPKLGARPGHAAIRRAVPAGLGSEGGRRLSWFKTSPGGSVGPYRGDRPAADSK